MTTDKPQTVALDLQNVTISYGDRPVLEGVTMGIYRHQVTTLIGPSGCGKSSLLRCLNRLNDLVPEMSYQGTVRLFGRDITELDPTEVRRMVGMVFQRPNPFPKSIFENVALGLRIHGYRGRISDMVEYALQQVGLWDEVKDRLRANALTLSGGQQQRLCIARALALCPRILLLDEPCASLDPVASLRIDNLLERLKQDYTIVVVTHNLQQAARIGDRTAFFALRSSQGQGVGVLEEYDLTARIFIDPQHLATRDYVTRR